MHWYFLGEPLDLDISLELSLQLWSAFREFYREITVTTNAQLLTWQQVRGPTLVINSVDEDTISIERPNIFDDPFIIKFTAQKTFAGGVALTKEKDLYIYTTPASAALIHTDSIGTAYISEQLFFDYWFLPIDAPGGVKLVRAGDSIDINWLVYGNIDVSPIIRFQWIFNENNIPTISSNISNGILKSFSAKLGSIYSLKCYFYEYQILIERETRPAPISDNTLCLAQDSLSVTCNAVNQLTIGGLDYINNIYEDNVSINTNSTTALSLYETPYIFELVGSSVLLNTSLLTSVSYQDLGLTVGAI